MSGTIATIDELMRARRSVRGFLAKPVPADLIEHIFETAQQAPSNCNVQPWVVHVVSGAAAERMRSALSDAATNGRPLAPEVPLTGPYPGAYRGRQVDSAKALFAATGIARDDGPARTVSFLRNFRFFDAPHAAFIFVPAWAGMREASDCGMFALSLMLALTDHGLASCAQGALGHYAPIVHEQLGVPADLLLLYGIAFGYEDLDHPANTTRTVRAPLAECVTFHN